MKCETITLKDNYSFIAGGTLHLLCGDAPFDGESENGSHPLVLVLPGGAYLRVSKREGEPVARDFFAEGYHVGVLEYLCRPQGAQYPEQLYEVACAIHYIKKNAARLHIDAECIFLVGFSAGGHLAGDYANEYPTLPARMGISFDASVRAVGLSYPVIDEHDDSFENLLYGYEDAEKARLKEALALTKRVGVHTPPTFIWTTAEDRLVPPQNTLRYTMALADNAVPYECHIYPKGGHGLSNASAEINDAPPEVLSVVSAWTKDMARFFRSYCINSKV